MLKKIGKVLFITLLMLLSATAIFAEVNIIQNPGFESGLLNWTKNSGTVVVDNSNSHSGNGATLYTQSKISQVISSGFTIGKSYTISAWGKVSETSQRGYVQIYFLNSSGSRIGYGNTIQFSTGNFLQLTSPSFVIPTGTKKLRIECWKNSGKGKFFVDDLSIMGEGDTPPIPPAIPVTPTGLGSKNITESSATLVWNSVSGATNYKLYSGNSIVYNGAATSFVHTGLLPSTTYTYKVSAINSYGESAASGNITFTTNANITPPVNPPDSSVYRNNHAYLDTNRYYSSNDSIITAVNTMKSYSIKYQFIDLGLVDQLGHLEPDIQPMLANYIKVSKATDANQKIIAVINCEWRDTILGNTSVQSTLRAEISTLCKTFAIDGVHLDIEPISLDVPNDMRYINFVKTLKPVMSGKELSVTGVCWSDVWSNSYIAQMASYVDMINIMLYDTNGPSSWEPYITHNSTEYTNLWKTTILRFSNAIAASTNPKCMLAPTMPCYSKRIDSVSGVPYHNPDIENIQNASLGLKQAIAEGANVYGSGVFWWGSLISTKVDKDGHNYLVDRQYWNDWINTK